MEPLKQPFVTEHNFPESHWNNLTNEVNSLYNGQSTDTASSDQIMKQIESLQSQLSALKKGKKCCKQ